MLCVLLSRWKAFIKSIFYCYHTCRRLIFVQQQPQKTKFWFYFPIEFSLSKVCWNFLWVFKPRSEGKQWGISSNAVQMCSEVLSWPHTKKSVFFVSLANYFCIIGKWFFHSSVRMSNFYQLNMLFCASFEQHFSCIQIERNIKNPFGWIVKHKKNLSALDEWNPRQD